ncbi:response regulator [Granulicella sp. WH15]|uniref:response regulator n=1 Tax=Granulicella sp. WH15 TaxID=2602070 RepID=UPI0013678CB6|nr:response regulator [Granulicella sp. WH15]QHN03989.1 response regulator [Granulicella sp. WH15]
MTNRRILIANHDQRVSNELSSFLRRSGYDVSLACNSDDAIRVAKNDPALLIIDPVMPGLSGLEAANHIFAATGCKVLFLTDLAGDEDFQALVDGLVRDGIDCAAFATNRPNADLVAYIQAAIGVGSPAEPLTTSSSTQSPERPPDRSEGANDVAPTGQIQASPYTPLFAVANAKVYQSNAFRLTGLQVSATSREIKRAYQEFGMSKSLNRAWKPKCLISSAVEPDDDDLEAAFALISDPEKRLLQDFFWFWPDGAEDSAFASLAANDSALALAEWGRRSIGDDPRGIATHNLAVFSHLRALEGETSGISGQTISATTLWGDAFRHWQTVATNSRFWDHYIQRIKEMNDPRITPELARSMWRTLPEALLYINAQNAVKAGEKSEYAEAARQRQLMYSSGLGTEHADKALYRALTPLLEYLTLICQQATSKVDAAPEQGATVVESLRTAKTPILKTLNCLVGVNDQRRNDAHDQVARTIRGCLIDYVNKTDGWAVALPLFEDCMALAHSEELRARLAEEIGVVERKLAASGQGRPGASAGTRSQSSSRGDTRQASSAAQGTSKAVRRGYALGQVWRKLPKLGKMAVGMVVAILVIVILVLSSGGETNNTSDSSPASGTTLNTNPPVAPISIPDSSTDKGSTAGSNQASITSLREEIAQSKARLASLEGELQSLNSEMDDYKSKIDADKATLEHMESDNGAGVQIDQDEYERVRSRHNRNVRDFNADISRGHSLHSEYEDLLGETNTKIDNLNKMVNAQ